MKKIEFLSLLLLLTLSIVGCCPCRRGGSAPRQIELGSSWQALQIGSKSLDSGSSESYSITFGADGKLMGQGDCNRIMGDYATTPNRTLTLSNVASTRAMCPDAQGEMVFIDALSSADGYTIDNGMLMLLSKGSVVMILESRNEQ